MNTIKVEGIKVYAFHGCLDAEAKIGADYTVDVIMNTDFSEAAKSDNLSKTIDYVEVYNIVKVEMAQRSKLIEHVAQRIVDQLNVRLGSALHKISLTVTKHNPPMNGNVEKVSVVIEE
jgi:7,8-dihydroneopterin aldolase/epimerase/oxygenase